MFDINEYIESIMTKCKAAFGERLMYIGLQGSYLRGEAHEDSDIDIMVIIDRFTVEDMDTYRSILKDIGYYEKSCGFICGKAEMSNWNPLEVCQLHHTTKDLFGTLGDFLPAAGRQDEINYVKFSLGNIYHELCHRYIHSSRDKNTAKLRLTCKGLFFLIQNIYYLESGRFINSREELKKLVSAKDRAVLKISELPDNYDFDKAFRQVFVWCADAFERINGIT